MTTLYAKSRALPVCAWLLLAACAGPSTRSDEPAWQASTVPDATLQAFRNAWNSRDRTAVLERFQSTRRSTINAAPELDEQLTDWEAASHVVMDRCSGRGTHFKMALVTFTDRRSGASIEEIVWIHLQDGGWWMYSL